MRKIRTTAAIGVVLLVATGFVANAQTPRNSVERNVSAMCTKADFDGDSFRPFVCDPKCPCYLNTILGQYPNGACQEGPAGDFVADLTSAPPTCVVPGPPFPPEVKVCYPSSSENCRCSCEPDQTGSFCTTPIVCQNEDCSVPTDTCVVNPDSGILTMYGFCIGYCDEDSDCTPAPAQLQILGLGDGSDETLTATCSVPGESPVSMNPNDARACIAQIETALGQPCTPFVP